MVDNNRIKRIGARVSVQGKLTLQDLRELENNGVNLTQYVSEEEVSKGNVSYEKYATLMEYIRGVIQ